MKKIFLSVILAAVLIMFGQVLKAKSCYASTCLGDGTIWVPTESGKVDVQYLGQNGDVEFAIFDDQADFASDPYFLLTNIPNYGTADTVMFVEQPNGDWGLKHESDPAPSFFLSGSNKFLLAMRTDDNSPWLAGNDLRELSYGMHSVCWPDTNIEITQIDAQPVPIPATIYLFGFGLLGIAGFRKRR